MGFLCLTMCLSMAIGTVPRFYRSDDSGRATQAGGVASGDAVPVDDLRQARQLVPMVDQVLQFHAEQIVLRVSSRFLGLHGRE